MSDDAKDRRLTSQWSEDFPIDWERDHYVTRRELAKFLVLGSAILAGASSLLAVLARREQAPAHWPRVPIGRLDSIPPGGSVLFDYPAKGDPCIAVRDADGTLHAYAQVCTHLSCAVVHRPGSDTLDCPCHHGLFAVADGRPIAGPPTRRLPRIHLRVVDGDIYAVDKEL